jgi:hypothetical protein
MRKMCTLITSKGTDIDENIANQNHATRTRTPIPGYLNLSNLSYFPSVSNKFRVQYAPQSKRPRTQRQSLSKEIRRAEHEYMNMHPAPPPPPPIIRLATALVTKL